MKRLRVKVLIFAFIASVANALNSSDPEVTIPLGTIRGRRINLHDKFVDEYLGVPYAKPPVGDLRFAKPKPITEKWNSTYIAQSLPSGCVQRLPMPMSEDCLYLSVYNLENHKSENGERQLKPVLFWIHGGGFENGSSREYNGSFLAKLSDSIVVTINYRLSVFGFLFGNCVEIPGNVALYDQLLALKWVHENIVFFGGDKNQVTIFGESAGSMSVSLHLMSKLSRPYYNQAIMMSGVEMDYLVADPQEWALKRAKALATVVGCNSAADARSLPLDVINCLRKIDANTLLSASQDPRVMMAAQSLMFPIPFLPIFGDCFLPKSPREVWRRKKFKRNTSLLIGTVYNELGAILANSVKPEQKPSDVFREYCATSVPSEFLTKPECEELIRIYYTGIDEVKERQRAIDTVSQMYDDITFHCPSIALAEVFSEVNPVYQYFFNYKSKNDSPFCGPKYPCHASDLPFTFGWVRNREDLQPTLVWVRIISEFAKTGKTFWPQYYRTSLNKLVPVYYEFKGSDSINETQIALKEYKCQIWKSFVFKKRIDVEMRNNLINQV